ncbi:AsmA family protein [Sphingomonas morindae]|uniref:AsmA family protein n=1 Tax=Sphingomonas morindae TaxID=1541170 RepID=A0ABY4X9J3_9SPHN|nr:AsmA family protein [Sphingomonas morindae]USI73355.1 AsmA family protein [Sphingomonas morindae]
MATTAPARTPAPPPPPAAPARRSGDAPIGVGLGVLACLLGLLMLAWVVLFVTKGRFLKPTAERLASRMLQRQVRIAGDFQLYLAPINVKFVADGLTISNPGWASRPNFLEAAHIDTRVSTIRLLFGERHARWLNLDRAAVDTEWDQAHLRNTWTFGDPNKKGAPFQWPVIDRATVTGTTLRYRDPQMQITTDQRFDTVHSSDTHIDEAIRFQGGGTLRGQRFTNAGALLSPNSTVRLGRNRLELHADAGPTHVDLNGVLPAATQIEGSDLHLKARGPNMRLMFDLLGIVIPDTRAFRFTSDLTKVGPEWRFTRLAGRFGDSDLAGRMTVSVPDGRPRINATLASRQVDILDVGPFIGYAPETLASKGATAAATTQSRRDHPRILPDAPLRAEALKRFDAHVDYKVATVRAPNLPVSNIALTLDLDHNLLALSPLTMDLAGGHLASDIALDARQPAVRTSYDIRLSPTPMGRLLKGFGIDQPGTTGTVKARIKMEGTGDSVRKSLASANGRIAIALPAGTFFTSYAQLSEFDIGVFVQKLLQNKLKQPIQINCGLIAFTVRDGVATADPILIDTSKNVMSATGGFSFKDESLNLTFRARAKKFSAFSGQSPVGIRGYFAAPALQIVSPQLLGRAGAAVALGVVATPLASILAFVDPGTTPDTACGPVLEGAHASAMRTEKGKPVKGLGTKAENREEAAKPKKKFLGIF